MRLALESGNATRKCTLTALCVHELFIPSIHFKVKSYKKAKKKKKKIFSPFTPSTIRLPHFNRSVISASLSLLCFIMRQTLLIPPLARSFSARASPTRSPPAFPLSRSSGELTWTTLSWRLSVCNCCHISAARSRFFRLVSAHLSQELVWEECGGTAVWWQSVGAPTRMQ